MRVEIVDYGAGNLASVLKAFAAIGVDARIAAVAADIGRARAIVVPGVGHFGATQAIGADWRAAIQGALDRGASLLGICLGMQWLFDGSDEAPGVPGLGVFNGRCRRLAGDAVKVPHVGWNTLDRQATTSRLLDGIGAGNTAYFTHTFAAPVATGTTATTTHGETFASVVERGRVYGAQFHPEKSGAIGLRLLENFVRAAAAATA